jgi:hypothetical protein
MSSARHMLNEDPYKRKRKERIDQSPYNLPNVDVPGLIFAVLAVVFVVYPLAQWALGR